MYLRLALQQTCRTNGHGSGRTASRTYQEEVGCCLLEQWPRYQPERCTITGTRYSSTSIPPSSSCSLPGITKFHKVLTEYDISTEPAYHIFADARKPCTFMNLSSQIPYWWTCIYILYINTDFIYKHPPKIGTLFLIFRKTKYLGKFKSKVIRKGQILNNDKFNPWKTCKSE